MARHQHITYDKKKASFPCIAVIAAIDCQGKVVKYHLQEKSIKRPEFVKFLKVLFRLYKN